MTQPDPDPTNREQILDEWQKAVDAAGGGGNTLDLLQALMAAGYQIVPKVELEQMVPKSHLDDANATITELLLSARTAALAPQALDKENG